MSNGRRRKQAAQQQRPNRPAETRSTDIWRPVPPLPDPEPIAPAGDPTAMVRSLGDPPLPGVGVVAQRNIVLVTARAASRATALAALAGLLAQPDDD